MAAENPGVGPVDDHQPTGDVADLETEVEELRTYKRSVEDALGSLDERAETIVATVEDLGTPTVEGSQLLARIVGETGELKETIESIAREHGLPTTRAVEPKSSRGPPSGRRGT